MGPWSEYRYSGNGGLTETRFEKKRGLGILKKVKQIVDEEKCRGKQHAAMQRMVEQEFVSGACDFCGLYHTCRLGGSKRFEQFPHLHRADASRYHVGYLYADAFGDLHNRPAEVALRKNMGSESGLSINKACRRIGS